MSCVLPSRILASKSQTLPFNLFLADNIGKAEALFLQQLHYWITSPNVLLGKMHEGKRWIYNSYQAWSKDLKVYSPKTMARAAKKLEERGIVLSDFLSHFKGNRTKWYTIDYDKLTQLFSSLNLEKSAISNRKKMSTWYGQNVQITTEITSENTGLNIAHAHETIQPLVEEYQQPVESVSTDVESTSPTLPTPTSQAHQELEPVLNPTPDLPTELNTACEAPLLTGDVFVDKCHEILQETLGSKLKHPLNINKALFAKTMKTRQRTHFGFGELGIKKVEEYFTAMANNDFLMGKKAMKSGDRFVLSVGSILSTKMIESYWAKTKFWVVYATRKQTDTTEGSGLSESPQLPTLSLEEVLTTARDPVDKKIKTKLYQVLGAVTYWSWIFNREFIAKGLDNSGEPVFEINSPFARDYVTTHHSEQLRNAFVCAMGDE